MSSRARWTAPSPEQARQDLPALMQSLMALDREITRTSAAIVATLADALSSPPDPEAWRVLDEHLARRVRQSAARQTIIQQLLIKRHAHEIAVEIRDLRKLLQPKPKQEKLF